MPSVAINVNDSVRLVRMVKEVGWLTRAPTVLLFAIIARGGAAGDDRENMPEDTGDDSKES